MKPIPRDKKERVCRGYPNNNRLTVSGNISVRSIEDLSLDLSFTLEQRTWTGIESIILFSLLRDERSHLPAISSLPFSRVYEFEFDDIDPGNLAPLRINRYSLRSELAARVTPLCRMLALKWPRARTTSREGGRASLNRSWRLLVAPRTENASPCQFLR